MEYSAAYICETHGAVVGYLPFDYREPEAEHAYRYGPFCPLCVSEWFAKNFATLKPVTGGGGSRA